MNKKIPYFRIVLSGCFGGPWNIRTNDPITDSDSVLEFDLAGKSFMHLPELTDIYGQVLNCSAVMTRLVSRMMRSVSRHMKQLMI